MKRNNAKIMKTPKNISKIGKINIDIIIIAITDKIL